MKLLGRTLFLIALLLIVTNCEQQYEQWYSSRYNLRHNSPAPYVQGWNVIPLLNITQILEVYDNQIWVLGNVRESIQKNYDFHIYRIENNDTYELMNTGYIPLDSKVSVLSINKQLKTVTIAIISPMNARVLECDTLICGFKGQSIIKLGKVNKVLKSQNKDITYIATDTGMYFLKYFEDLKKVEVKPYEIFNETVYDIAYSDKLHILSAGTMLRLWIFYEDFDYKRYEYTGSVIDNATTLVFRSSDSSLFVGSDYAVNVLQFFYPEDQTRPFYKVYRAGFLQGLPTPNLTISASFGDKVCMGGIYGATVIDGDLNNFLPVNYTYKRDWQGVGQVGSMYSPWKYFYEQRWLTAGNITAMHASQNKFVIATEYGLTILSYFNYTLEQKAQHFQKIAEERHNRFGYFSDNSLKIAGNHSSFELQADESDAIWTNMYLGAQALRYNVTKDTGAKNQSWIAFQALERLFKVTPIVGLMARTTPDWINSTSPGYENWTWQNGTSSDDVISYYVGIPLFIDFVCETEEEKNRAIGLLVNTTDYIIKNNYYLVDIDGKHTKWGFWGPNELNDNPDHYSERGGNSVEILGMLAITYHYKKDQKYLDEIQRLGDEHQYFQNAINFRNQYSEEVNFSDDELGYFGLFAYLYHKESLPIDLQYPLLDSLNRAYKIVREYKPSLWTLLSFLLDNSTISQTALNDCELELQQWTLDIINYKVDNTKRIDVVVTAERSRDSVQQPRSVDALKKSERASNIKWNSDPYGLKNDDGGTSEFSPAHFLFPYYLKQYLTQNGFLGQLQQKQILE